MESEANYIIQYFTLIYLIKKINFRTITVAELNQTANHCLKGNNGEPSV